MTRIWLLLIAFLPGCNAETSSETRLYADPISGEEKAALVTDIEGWQATQFVGAPEKFVMISGQNRPIVSILGDGPGRDIYVEGKNIGADQVVLRTGADNSIEEIEFFSDGVLYRLNRSGGEWTLQRHSRKLD